jgi:hypothetical protein
MVALIPLCMILKYTDLNTTNHMWLSPPQHKNLGWVIVRLSSFIFPDFPTLWVSPLLLPCLQLFLLQAAGRFFLYFVSTGLTFFSVDMGTEEGEERINSDVKITNTNKLNKMLAVHVFLYVYK